MSDEPSERPPPPTRPLIVYKRQTLLKLYASPLVPQSLPGMKKLSEWYGEYVDPPSSPHRQREPLLPGSSSNSNRDRTGDGLSTASRRSNPSNPFANFGRFGVDGGLETTGKDGKDMKRGGRDGAPHLVGVSGGGRDGERAKDGERRVNVNGRGEGRTLKEERELEAKMKKEGRAEEGGWRSVGSGRDRLRPLPLSTSSNSTSAPPRSGRPSWMDDDNASSSSPSSGAPAWMDAPSTGDGGLESFASASSNMRKEKASSAWGTGSGKSGRGDTEWTPGGAKDGAMDDIQMWKKQMKELEAKTNGKEVAEERHTDETPAQQPSVFSSFLASKPAPERPSVFDNLGLGTGISNTSTEEAGPGGAGRGRGSRFAKFFDGKPPPGLPLPAPQNGGGGGGGGLESLLAGMASVSVNGSGPEPSKEDRESMNRLLGMLQVSGTQSSTPAPFPTGSGASLPPHLTSPIASSPLPPLPAQTSQPVEPRQRQTSGGSRFAFSSANGAAPSPTSSQPLPPGFQQQQHSPLPPQQPQQHASPSLESRPMAMYPGTAPQQFQQQLGSPPLSSPGQFNFPPGQGQPPFLMSPQQQPPSRGPPPPGVGIGANGGRSLDYGASPPPQHANGANPPTSRPPDFSQGPPPNFSGPPPMHHLPPMNMGPPPMWMANGPPPGYGRPPSNFGPPPPGMFMQGPPPPMGYPGPPMQFQQRPPQSGPYQGPGADLMSLLNAGGMRGPPMPPPQQGVPRQQGPDMRQ